MRGSAVVIGTTSARDTPIRDGTATPPPNPHGLRSLELSPDGAIVATASQDGTIQLSDARTGAAIRSLAGHTGRARRVVFARDGRTAFSVGDTTLRSWDVATGRELARADLGAAGWDVAVLDDGTIATVTDAVPADLALWRAADLEPAIPLHVPSFLRDLVVVGDRVVVSTNTLVMLLGAQGFDTHQANVPRASAVWVGATTLAIADVTGNIVVLDRSTLAEVRSWHTPAQQLAVAARPDGRILATASLHQVFLWDPTTSELLAQTPLLPAMVFELAWSPDGTRLAFAGGSGTIELWELPRGDRAALSRLAACASPWRVEGSTLVAKPRDAAACTGVLPVQ